MSAVIDLEQRQRIAVVRDRLLRDLNNAQAAVEHHGGPMPETHFTLAALSALAEFVVDRMDPAAMGQRDQVALLTDVFVEEMQQLVRTRAALQTTGAR